jgi:hypothetical protein
MPLIEDDNPLLGDELAKDPAVVVADASHRRLRPRWSRRCSTSKPGVSRYRCQDAAARSSMCTWGMKLCLGRGDPEPPIDVLQLIVGDVGKPAQKASEVDILLSSGSQLAGDLAGECEQLPRRRS